jgi:Family of unknown function (DUF6788)
MSQQLSSLRSQLLKVRDQLPQLLEECLARAPLIPGSLYTLRRKCGKSRCHCNRGELHQSTVLSYRGQGRPRNISPPHGQLESLRTMTQDYRRCRQARAKIVRWQRQLLTLVDALEAARIQQGEAEFHRLRASRSVKKSPSPKRS